MLGRGGSGVAAAARADPHELRSTLTAARRQDRQCWMRPLSPRSAALLLVRAKRRGTPWLAMTLLRWMTLLWMAAGALGCSTTAGGPPSGDGGRDGPRGEDASADRRSPKETGSAGDSRAKDAATKDSTSGDSRVGDARSKDVADSTSRDTGAVDARPADAIVKDVSARDARSRDARPGDSRSKDAVAKDSASKDATLVDGASRDATFGDAADSAADAPPTATTVLVSPPPLVPPFSTSIHRLLRAVRGGDEHADGLDDRGARLDDRARAADDDAAVDREDHDARPSPRTRPSWSASPRTARRPVLDPLSPARLPEAPDDAAPRRRHADARLLPRRQRRRGPGRQGYADGARRQRGPRLVPHDADRRRRGRRRQRRAGDDLVRRRLSGPRSAPSRGSSSFTTSTPGTTTYVEPYGMPLDEHELRCCRTATTSCSPAPSSHGVDLTGLGTFGPDENMIGCDIQEVDPTGARGVAVGGDRPLRSGAGLDLARGHGRVRGDGRRRVPLQLHRHRPGPRICSCRRAR